MYSHNMNIEWGDMKMSVSIADGGGDEHIPNRRFMELFQQQPQDEWNPDRVPKEIDEDELASRLSKGCKIIDIQLLLSLSDRYKAEWTPAQQIAYHEEFGWQEMLQYRPGLLAAGVLAAQENSSQTLPPSFQWAAAIAFGWPMHKVYGFQMGICKQLFRDPFLKEIHPLLPVERKRSIKEQNTRDENDYMEGLTLGYMFYEAKQQREQIKQLKGE